MRSAFRYADYAALKEYAAGLLFDLFGGGEGDAGGVAAAGRHDHFRGPGVDVAVPDVHGVVIQLARGGDLFLQIGVLLHCIGDLGVGLEVGVVFKR